MINETRRNLDKATEELIESFIKFDKNKAMQLKVGLEAIHHAQRDKDPSTKTNLYSVCDYDLLHSLLEEHGITKHEFEKVPSLIEGVNQPGHLDGLSEPLKAAVRNVSSGEKPEQGVPSSGMVAVMFNMVSEKVKNALIAGQAGERTLKAIERATTSLHPSISKENALKDTLYDYGSKQRLARPYIGGVKNEPDYLISAKAIQHLADLFEISLKLHPAAREFDSTEKSMLGFNKLAACIFKHAADNLHMASAPEAAEKIKALASHVEDIHKAEEDEDIFHAVESGMKILQEALHSEGIITAQEAEDYKELVSKRIEQIKKIEVV